MENHRIIPLWRRFFFHARVLLTARETHSAARIRHIRFARGVPLAMWDMLQRGWEVSGAPRHHGQWRANKPPRHGLPLFGGVRLAVDTIVVCALHGDGRPRSGVDERDGVAFFAARKAKERIYPEFVGVQARARLVPAVQVGRMFSKETDGFFTGLAKARAQSKISAHAEASGAGMAIVVGCLGARRYKLLPLLFQRCKGASAQMGPLQRGMR